MLVELGIVYVEFTVFCHFTTQIIKLTLSTLVTFELLFLQLTYFTNSLETAGIRKIMENRLPKND